MKNYITPEIEIHELPELLRPCDCHSDSGLCFCRHWPLIWLYFDCQCRSDYEHNDDYDRDSFYDDVTE